MVLDSLLLCLPWLQDPFACPRSTAPSFLSFAATKSARGPFLPSSPHTCSASGRAGAGVPFWPPLPLLSFRRRKKDMSHHSVREMQHWKRRERDLLLQRKFLLRQSAVAVFYYLCNCITACRLPHTYNRTVKSKVMVQRWYKHLCRVVRVTKWCMERCFQLLNSQTFWSVKISKQGSVVLKFVSRSKSDLACVIIW